MPRQDSSQQSAISSQLKATVPARLQMNKKERFENRI
jgi:hypothetical protein